MVGRTCPVSADIVDQGIFPSSITRIPLRLGSRRASVVSRHSGSYARPSGSFFRSSSSHVDLLNSPSSGVFAVDSEDERPSAPPPHMSHSFQSSGYIPQPKRKESRRRSRAQSSQAGGYFGYRPEHPVSGDDERADDDAVSPLASPLRPATALGKIASYIGFARPEADEEQGHKRSRSRSRSERGSASSHESDRRSATPTTSGESWGYGDEDDGYSEHEREEGYSSSLADDTSLPPQSRPQSPHLPLIPNNSDGIFGDPARGHDVIEAKDFVSLAVPSRQTILLPDEDLSIRFTGYRTDPFWNTLWWVGCILTFGVLALFGRWVPSVWVRFCGKEIAFEDGREGSWLVVEVGSPRAMRSRPHAA